MTSSSFVSTVSASSSSFRLHLFSSHHSIMRFAFALLTLASASVVLAQNQPACSSDCFTKALANPPAGCSGATDLPCLCTNADFEAGIVQCLTTTCVRWSSPA
jgi:hypothetical protein